MAGARFDIKFAGELMGDADPDEARRQIQRRFNLPDEAAARLFSGHPVIIKRAVDIATASRYRELFRDAKALVQIQPVPAASEPAPDAGTAPTPAGEEPSAPDRFVSDDSGLGLAPLGEDQPLERPPIADLPAIDVSHLSLVLGQDWSLEDCQQDAAPAELPDISHLRVITPSGDDGQQGDATEESRKS